MQVDGEDEAKVQVLFTSELVTVPDNAFAVPARLTRAGLAKVINGLLEHDDESAMRFDFLINGELLRSSLATFLSNRHVRAQFPPHRICPCRLASWY